MLLKSNKLIKLFSAMITICFLISVAGSTVSANDLKLEEFKQKFSKSDYDENSIIVVLNKQNSGINKAIDKAFTSAQFSNILKIEDLTRIPNYGNEPTAVNEKEFRQIFKIILKSGGQSNLLDAMLKLDKLPMVESVCPDYIIQMDLFEYMDPVIPNDILYYQQYAPRKINADVAWNYSTGSPNVAVAVLDTGIKLDHPDLAANIWTKPGEIPNNGIDDDGNGYIDDYHGWNFAYDNNDPSDDDGHGTHVAGIIGAIGNNGIGIAGVCSNVKLVPVKILNSFGGANFSDLVAGINYVSSLNIPIINASWGHNLLNFQELYNAINNYSGLFIAAAGNDGKDNDIASNSIYPASFPLENIISVASTNENDILSNFSSYGAVSVDLAAPGSSIVSTVNYFDYTFIGYYAMKSGTSMAAPQVAGAAALIKSLNPHASTSDIKNAILQKVDPVPSLSGKVATGGRLNVMESLTFFVIFGDVNQDGFLTVSDVTLLRSHIMNPTLTGNALIAADVNRDGTITVADVTALRSLIMNS